MEFTEELLCFLWKFRLFNQKQLATETGEALGILSPGIHNRESGPDFEQAKIKIGSTIWAGNIEMHLRSSDWDNHRHSRDRAYNNVILHVVVENDRVIKRPDGTEIPTLVVKDLIPEHIKVRYRDLIENLYRIPCENRLNSVDEFHINGWLGRVLIERLEEKSSIVFQFLDECKGSWDDAFYIMLARNFGFKINALPFELLAKSLPQTILAKHKSNSLQIEALIFGQAGFLADRVEDDYFQQLQKEYYFLRKKYNLHSLDKSLWKFLRLRPNNFPTLRLAQFSALVVKSNHLLSEILETKDPASLRRLFDQLPVHPYWDNHYLFGKPSLKKSSGIGQTSVNNILLNTVALFIFAYGKRTGVPSLVSRAIEILEGLPFEENQITAIFTEIGVKKRGADLSQALLQQKKRYCDTKRCLDCGIGTKLINQN